MVDVDDDKPFVCSTMGCGMRFTNEDHLNVHMKKHEMSLALNMGSHSSSPAHHFLDQTPTPTKFLKNCEEIGLFQELSKNPFEEAFKKASDVEGVPIPGPQSNELNTPVPPSLNDKTPGSLFLADVTKAMQSPTSSSAASLLSKQDSILLPSETFALDLSGRRAGEKISAMQPSSTTVEEEEVAVSRVISIADSTQSPSKTTPSTGPMFREVVVTQANSSLPGSKTSPTQIILTPPLSATQQTVVTQQIVSNVTSAPSPVTSPSQSQGQQACTMQVYLQLPTGQTVPVHIPATISTVLPAAATTTDQQPPRQQTSPAPHTQPAKLAVRQVVSTAAPTTATSSMALKQRLKQTLQAAQQQQQQLQQQQQQQQGIVSSSSGRAETVVAVPTVHSQVSPVVVHLESPKMELSLADSLDSTYESSSKRHKGASSDSEDPDERRRKFLERNRAAAARCRQKRKHWISNLEKKAEELQQTNNRLQSEVSLLRGEVAQLKTLLLAHQDCPITLQQKSQGQLALHTISLVESASSVPFEVSQLVSSAGATISTGNQQVPNIPIISESSQVVPSPPSDLQQ